MSIEVKTANSHTDAIKISSTEVKLYKRNYLALAFNTIYWNELHKELTLPISYLNKSS